MRVVCSVITALAVLSLGVEARIGAQRKLQEDLVLDVVADGTIPQGSLGLCQGECDRDRDCAEGLVCFQRDASQPIPGCPDEGPGFDSKGDYCVKKPEEEEEDDGEEMEAPGPEDEPEPEPEDEPEPEEVAEEAVEATQAPTEVDMETAGPTEEDGTVAPTEDAELTVAPTEVVVEPETPETMAPTAGDTELETAETVAPTEEEPAMAMEKPEEEDDMGAVEAAETMDDDEPVPLSFGGQDGEGAFPLAVCQGDCDNDEECGEGLICWQRGLNDPVPGCVGRLDATTDFCVLAKYGGATSGPEDSETMGPSEGGSEASESPVTFAPSE